MSMNIHSYIAHNMGSSPDSLNYSWSLDPTVIVVADFYADTNEGKPENNTRVFVVSQ